MCMSYSGRCLLSAFLNKRAQTAALHAALPVVSYSLVEEKRPGEFFPIIEDSSGAYIFNSKDLCLIEHIAELSALGIRSFKIEGRMKGPLYLASVTRAYRQAIDRCAQREGASPPRPDRGCKPLARTAAGNEAGRGCEAKPSWTEDLLGVSHRRTRKGFSSTTTPRPNQPSKRCLLHTRPNPGRDGPGFFRMRTRRAGVSGSEISARNGAKGSNFFPDGVSRFHILDNMRTLAATGSAGPTPTGGSRSRPISCVPFQVVRTINAQNRRAGNS